MISVPWLMAYSSSALLRVEGCHNNSTMSPSLSPLVFHRGELGLAKLHGFCGMNFSSLDGHGFDSS